MMKCFSKIKKAVVCTLAAVCLLLVGAGISACKKKGGEKNNVPTLYGFDIAETINVEQYGLVLPQNVHVTGKDGTMYDVVVKVRDSQGNIVFTDEGNKFNAKDVGGYTITYTIETWDFSISKTVNVVVISVAENLDFTLDCSTLVSVGDTVEVGVDGNMSNPTYTMSVTNEETGEPCATDGLTFVPTAVGKYSIQMTVNADEGTATQTKTIYARKAVQEGEIEVFDKDWRTVREFSPKYVAEEGSWSLATTAETGVKDIDGNDGTFAVLETDAEYTHIYFNIRESRAYYRNLAMQGYTHVRFRVYVESSLGKSKLFNWEHNSTNSWRTSLGYAPAGTWKEFYIPLATGVAGTSDKRPGFIESYEYYQSTWILLLDNSTGSWNASGREVDEDGNPIKFKIYFDDIFAVRKTYETSINTTIDKDVYDLSSMLDRAWGTDVEDYTYNITKHTEYGAQQKQLVNGATLTSNDVDLSGLTGNDTAYGSYEISYFVNGGSQTIPYRKVWIDVMDPSLNLYGHMDLHNFAASARGMIWDYQDASANVQVNTDGTITYTTGGSWGAGLQIAPTFDKAYYEALQKAGYELTFDMKLDVQFAEGVSEEVKENIFKVRSFAEREIRYKDGETHTVKVKLSKIVDNYERLQNNALSGADPANDWYRYVLFDVIYDSTYAKANHNTLTFTISNIQMVKQG